MGLGELQAVDGRGGGGEGRVTEGGRSNIVA